MLHLTIYADDSIAFLAALKVKLLLDLDYSLPNGFDRISDIAEDL